MLSTFFEINFPYGLVINHDNYVACFNRGNLPLGQSDTYKHFVKYNYGWIYYKGLTDDILKELSWNNQILKNKHGYRKIWLYFEDCNPMYSGEWFEYYEKLKLLSTLERKRNVRGHYVDESIMYHIKKHWPRYK